MELKHYECMFVVAPNVDEAKREALIKQFAKMAGTDVTVEKLGMKKLGFYVVFNFKAEPTMPKKITDLMNITDGIVRSLFVVKNEVMLAQDIVRRANRAKAREEYAARNAQKITPETESKSE
jgi:small subunit ribosomal protein S6